MDSTSSLNGVYSRLFECSRLSALSEGLFVTLTLDPLAMVAPFEDAKLNARCLELENKRYLAIIGLGSLKTGDISHTFEFHLVSQGMAKTMPGLGVSSAMCIPIFPETDHPTREALQTAGIALPLSNCYYHSHNSTLLLEVSNIDNLSLCETRLPSDELERLDTVGVEDQGQSATNRRNLKPRANASALSQRPLLPFHDTVFRPVSVSQVSNASPVDFEIPRGYIDVPRLVAPAACVNPASSWVSALKSSDSHLHTNEGREDVHRQHFQPKVRVSLELDELGTTSLPSSIDFLEEIQAVHELLIESRLDNSFVHVPHAIQKTNAHQLLSLTRRCVKAPRLILIRSYKKLKRKATAIPIRKTAVLSGALPSIRRYVQNFTDGIVRY